MNVLLQPQAAGVCVQRMLADCKQFATREPVKAMSAAFGAGLLLNLLPTRWVVGTVTVLGATLLRPALLSLGVLKAAELCCQKNPSPIQP